MVIETLHLVNLWFQCDLIRMVTFIVLVSLLAVVYGGPWKGRPRPLASPPVDAAQWELHQRLLALEPSVLQESLDVGRLAQATTRECYRRTDDAYLRLHHLAADLEKLGRRIRLAAPQCVDIQNIKKAQDYFDKAGEDVYQCTHALSDVAASFEVEMTEKMVAARSQIMDIKQAMWFCQKYQPEVDKECLRRLEAEGLQVLAKLPERARAVVDRSQAESVVALHRLKRCLVGAVSAAEERHLAETEAIRQCFHRSQAADTEA